MPKKSLPFPLTVDTLVARLKKADAAYYESDTPVLSDNDYDELKERLKGIAPKHEYFLTVGAEVNREAPKAKVPVDMGSLSKIYPSGLEDWVENIDPDTLITFTPKLDGLGGLQHFKDNRLQAVFTRGKYERGRGNIGRVITNRVKGMSGIVQSFGHFPFEIAVRGEFMIHRSTFKQLFHVDSDYFKKNFAHLGKEYRAPRNFVGGMINALESNPLVELATKKMIFVAYMLYIKLDGEWQPWVDPKPRGRYASKMDMLSMLELLGFTTARYVKRELGPKRADEIQELYNKQATFQARRHLATPIEVETFETYFKNEHTRLVGKGIFSPGYTVVCVRAGDLTAEGIKNIMQRFRDMLDMEQDGIVGEIDNITAWEDIGFEADGATPAYARAFKLDRAEQDSHNVAIIELENHYANHGVHVPIAHFAKETAPEFGGARVTKVAVHNWKIAQKMKLGVGAKVKLIRSGDVIPHIVECTEPVRRFKFPTECVFCEGELTFNDTDLVCTNKTCKGLKYGRIHHFFSTIKVDGLSSGTIDRMFEAGYEEISQFIKVKKASLLELDKIGEKKATTLSTNLNGVLKGVELSRLMHATAYFADSTSGLGSTKLQWLLDHYGVKNVLKTDFDFGLMKEGIKGVGEKGVAQFKKGLPLFHKLFASLTGYVDLADLKEVKLDSEKLKGKVFCFTKFRDSDLEKRIKANGGQIAGSLSKKVTVLFSAGTSTKTARAEELGVKVVPHTKATSFVEGLL